MPILNVAMMMFYEIELTYICFHGYIESTISNLTRNLYYKFKQD